MFRKVTAIFFIIIANIVLLVHVVVPHHHHNFQVCIETSHDLFGGEDHHHSNGQQHDENSSSDCLLKSDIIIPSNETKQEGEFCCNFINYSHQYLYPNGSYYGSFFRILYLKDPLFVTNLNFRFIHKSYSVEGFSTVGLRAPPLS